MRPSRTLRQTGSATVEAIVLVPVVMIFVLLAVALGRYEMTRAEVIAAARAAVEAGAVMPSSVEASNAASAAAAPSLGGVPRSCVQTVVRTDTEHFVPGGEVVVTVTCKVDLSDLGVPGLPGTTTIVATEDAPIDKYRVVS
jgi:Flp pilus assembly protein TadG